MNKLLQAEHLTLQYRDAREPAVKDLSFSMEPGEILSLRGPSGAGKSTVVWALTGMLEDYNLRGTGAVTFLGDRVELDSPQLPRRSWRDIALVPQSSMSALNPVYTVEKTMVEMMQCHEPGKSREDCLPEIRRLMEAVCLREDVGKSYPHELSGGMKQRVSIALAMMYSPRLLILDEATTGLDLLVEADILGTIRRVRGDSGILMITHDRRLSEAFCHRCIEIGGRHE